MAARLQRDCEYTIRLWKGCSKVVTMLQGLSLPCHFCMGSHSFFYQIMSTAKERQAKRRAKIMADSELHQAQLKKDKAKEMPM